MYVSHYFLCEITGQTQRLLTEREAKAGLEPRWIAFEDAVTIFSKHQEYADNEMKRGAYLREYRALCAYQNVQENENCTIIPYDAMKKELSALDQPKKGWKK